MYGSNYPGGGGGYADPNQGGGGMPQPGWGDPNAQGGQNAGYPQGGGGGMPMPGGYGDQGGGGYGVSGDIGFGGGGYGGAPQQPGYGGAPQPGYGGAPQQPGYGGPPQQPGYGGAPQQPAYGGAPQQPGYGGAPQQPGYGGQQQPPYGAPQQPTAFGGAPQQPGYGGAPQQPGYGGQQQPGYGAPGQQHAGAGAYPSRPPPPNMAAASAGGSGGYQSGYDNTGLSTAMESMHIGPAGEVFRGTVKPAPNFNAENDVQVLRKAMRGAAGESGLGTDEKAIINVVGHRSNVQRQQIKKMFKTMIGKDLIDELKSELSGDFRTLMLALFYDSTYYDAYSLREAMKGAGTREGVLTEILTTRTNAEIEEIKKAYKLHFQRDLEKDMVKETSGWYKRVLVSCVQANRNELTAEQLNLLKTQGVAAIIDRGLAQREANELLMAGEKKAGTDEACFIRILALRNVYQLRATFEEYQKLAKRDIMSSIDREMSGDLRKALKTLALSVINRPMYFATCLQKAMKGLGTNDSALIRIIVSRSEIDLENIKDEFRKKTNKTLLSWVKDDTSGDYFELLSNLLGNS